ncbi:MAG TPA: NAD(P)H-dependent oxidoreductase subunit E [Anaerolineae bacterium]
MLIEKHKSEIDAILAKYPPERKRSAVIPILDLAQREYGYCSTEAIKEVAGLLDLDPTEVQSVVGFYTLFFDHKVGQHYIHVCTDMPCALRGADKFLDAVCAKLKLDRHKVAHGGDTTADGMFTVEATMCIAACDKAPCAQVDLEYAESLTLEKFEAILEGLRAGQPYEYTPTGSEQ